MCGIIGYVGNKNAKDVLISGLRSLEYRGYDSSGIAIAKNNKISIIKSVGKVSNLEEKIDKTSFSNIGIGHTRWATHGAPNTINAHPHKVGITTLVHNGIIENYIALKKQLFKSYNFKSETDTEIACALIDDLNKKYNNKLKALNEASKLLKGSYAFAIMFEDEPNKIYAIRKDSPLIIAKKENECFLASDISAILQYTNKYYLLEQNEIAILSTDSLNILNSKFKEVDKKENVYNGTKNDVMLNGYSHFMLKEIHDEVSVYKNIIHSYVPHLNIEELEKNFNFIEKYDNITIIGCGSAYHAGIIGKSLLEEYANTPVEVTLASEYRYKKVFKKKNELAIFISQSGETADTLEALRIAKKNNIDTLGIINVISSSMARESKNVIYTLAGCEIAVATTKAYLAQVLILSLITLTKGYQNKLINKEQANKYLKDLNILIRDTKSILMNKEDIHKIAKKIYKEREMFFIGRQIDFALSLEASLKMKEISYIHSEAYAAGELKHGTISLIDNNTIVLGIATDKNIASKTINNLKETKARGAKIILITTKELYKEYQNDHFYYKVLIVNNLNYLLQPLTIITTLQLLAYYVAKDNKKDIDKPKNLAKSVTVE